MTNEIKNVPELRFKEFSKEWEDNKLKDITTLLKDGTHGTHKDVKNGPWLLSAKNIKNNTINISDEDRKISITDYNKIYKNYSLEREDILLSIVGTIGRVSMVKDPVNIAFQRSVAIIRFSKPLESKFFLYLFETKEFKKKLYRNQVISAQPGIYLGDLAKFNLIYPLIIEEQEKIGDFFSKLDRQIELEEQKLEKLEEQKKGYMQKIFSQGLRFKDEEGNYYKEWDTKQLKDVLEFSNKRTTNENEYPVLTSSRQGLILQSDYYKNGKTFAESNIGYFILPKNYITYRSRSDDGIFKFNLNQIIDVGIISKYYPVFKGINTNQYYLTLHLNYQLKKEYIKYATGTSQLVLSQKNLQNIQTKLPSYEEQTKISDFFSKLDKLIDRQLSKVELVKRRKKSLLQKMFV